MTGEKIKRKAKEYSDLYLLLARNLSVLFLLALGLSYFLPAFLNLNYFFYLVVAIDTLALLFTKNKLVKEYVKYLFLCLLVLVAISSITYFEDVFLIEHLYSFLNSYLTHLTVLTIAAGIITFYHNRDVIDSVEAEKDQEEKAENLRAKAFDKKFPKLAFFDFKYNILKHFKEKNYPLATGRVLMSPIVFLSRLPYTFTKWMYKEGWWVVIGLVLILVLFTAIKVPHMELTFTGKHEMKYSAIVEPAKHMYEMNDPLWNQKKYRAVPIINPDGKYDSFAHYPLMEWGLYATFKIFPENSYEFNARMFTAFLGLIFLLGMFYLLKKFMSKKATLLVLLLLSTNVIIQFFSYVTVMDTTMLIFFIFSLIALINGLKRDWLPLIFLAGVLGGIGVNLKYSLIIISLFTYLLLIFFWPKKGLSQKLNYALYFFPFLVLETVFFRMSIRWLPKGLLLYGSIFVLIVLLHLLFYKYLNNIQKYSHKLFEKYFTWRRTIILGIIGGIIALLIIKQIDWVMGFTKDFITDRYLIFNWAMYETFLERWQNWATNFGYYLGLLGFASLWIVIKNKKTKLFIYSLLASSLFYWILVSKPLYFHEYYHHIFMITFLVSAGVLIYCTSKIYKLVPSVIVIILLASPILIQGYQDTNEWLSNENNDGLTETAKYLNENMGDHEFFLREGPAALSLYSNRKSLNENYAFRTYEELYNSLKEGIKRKNLSYALKNKKIKYYVTKGKNNFNKKGFFYLYNNESKKEVLDKSYRSIIILCNENNECFYKKFDEEKQRFFDEEVMPYLKLEKNFGNYYIYRFNN